MVGDSILEGATERHILKLLLHSRFFWGLFCFVFNLRCMFVLEDLLEAGIPETPKTLSPQEHCGPQRNQKV